MSDKIRTISDQRSFTMVYNDFLRSSVLTPNERIIFIYLKMHAGSSTGKSFPSLATLSSETGLSKSTVQRCLAEMQDKGVIKVTHRQGSSGNRSNLYTLRDNARLWQAKDRSEMQTIASEIEENEMIKYLQSRGYEIIKKEPSSTADQSQDEDPITKQNNIVLNNNTATEPEKQDEEYPLDKLRELYGYDVLVKERHCAVEDVDAVMEILHDILNSTRPKIRIGGEDKPSQVVKGKLLKLGYAEVDYSIRQYNSVTDRINNPKAYILAILFGSKEQLNLDIGNQVKHDMYKETDDTD